MVGAGSVFWKLMSCGGRGASPEWCTLSLGTPPSPYMGRLSRASLWPVIVEGPFCFGHAGPVFLLNIPLRVEAGVLATRWCFAS